MNKHAADEITFSFICPLDNQAATLEGFHEQLKAAADALGTSYEIIFINDGSDDETLEVLRTLAKRNSGLRYLDLSRRFGPDQALFAGYDSAVGRAVVSLAADGRHRAEDIALLIEKWQAGAEVVQATALNAAPGAARHDCLRLLDRKVVAAFADLPRRPASIAEALDWVGFRRAEAPYPAPADAAAPALPRRRFLERIGALASLSALSIRTVAVGGLVMIAAAVAYLLIAGILAIFTALPFWWLPAVGVLLVGVQLTALAAVGTYVGDIHQQTRVQPGYVVRHAHGFAEAEPAALEAPDRQHHQAERFTVLT